MAELDELLDALSKPGRVAAAAASVEHVADLYRLGNFDYQVGTASADFAADPSADVLTAGLALAWAFVERGETPSPAALQAFNDITMKAPPGMQREDQQLPALQVLDAIELVFRAIDDPTPHAAFKALETCQDAVGDMVEAATDDDEKGDRACEQEEKWQRKVIARAKSRDGGPSRRADFDDLIAEALPWRKHLDAYVE